MNIEKKRDFKIKMVTYATLILFIIVVLISYIKYGNKSIDKENKKNTKEVVVATETPDPTPIPTPRVEKVGVKYKKGKLLQEHTVYHYSSYNRDHNLNNAAKRLTRKNGYLLLPLKNFSFFGAIGAPTAENGFVLAGVIENGQSVLGMAGGICEVATSLNTVVVDAGITTNARPHSKDVGYLNETDHEATVSYDSGIDLKFENTLGFPILIKQKAVAGNVTSKLFKVRTIYVVTYKDVVTGKTFKKKFEEKKILSEHEVKDNNSNKRVNKNLKIAAKAINGTIVFPQNEFSFFKTAGEITTQNGYKRAGMDDLIGYGIGKNVTSINTAIKKLNIETEDEEATVSGDAEKDFTFVNTLKFPIVIKQEATKGNVITQIVKLKEI